MRLIRVVTVFCLLSLFAFSAQAFASGVTNSGDDLRTGWYPNSSTLTPQLVSGGSFGQLWSASVEGQVTAQPLLANGTLVVATEKDKVYGLDPASGAIKWTKGLGTPWNPADIGCGDITPSIGTVATPVIDTASNTAYLTHKTYASGSSGPARWYMDAINISSGAEQPGFPVEIAGNAQNAPGVAFNPTVEMNRPGLLLMEGVVYAAFGSHCDYGGWRGWIFGVSTAGKVMARYVDNTTETGAGIWQSGAGLTSDGAGTILFSTGNGGAPSKPAPGNAPPANLGESVVRVRVQPDGSLKPVDFFAPFDASSLDSYDADFASGGVTGLPSEYFGTSALPHLAVADGKSGYVYLLNRDSLGGIAQGPSGSDKVVQRLGPRGGVWSRPGVWPGDGGYVYIPTSSGSEAGGHLDVYKYGLSGSGQPSLSLAGSSEDAFGWGSGAPVITSEGTTSGSALVWIVWSANRTGAGGQLRAYDPIPLNGHPVLRYKTSIGTASNYSTPGIGAGRVYVANREGKVFGFGSPVTPALTGPATAFPTTTLGSSSQRTLTLTATEALTLSSISSSSKQFTLGTATPTIPAALVAGGSVSVPVTFTPTETGLVGGTLTATTSTGKTIQFAVSGVGQTASAQLSVTPPLVTFPGTAVGGHATASATFRNVGAAPLTITKVNLPGAPFSATGVPLAGESIAPGVSVTVTVAFDPTQGGTFNDNIGLETTGGNGQVGLSGTSGSSGALKISSETNEFANQTVGTSQTKSFTITNNGGTAVTITKSKPPIGGSFAAGTLLPEGTTINAGESVTEKVTFTPTGPGYSSGTWQINGDDTSGLHQVQFSGTGTVPAPAAGSWTSNGTAAVSGATLTLTKTATYSAGTSFFDTPLDTHHLLISFDSTIGGGTVGADGQTLVLADPARGAKVTSLGYRGGGLGFSGIAGLAVALVTYKSTGAPSANFAGITDGPVGSALDAMHWLATSTAVPALRAKRHVTIEVLAGTLTMTVEGVQVLKQAVTLPSQVLLGFSGATGGYTDNHQVSNVVISGDSAPAAQPATLKLTNTVSAPAGSPQQAAQMTFAGSCPSAFTTAALASGASASPPLTGAVAASPCTVSETAPAAAGGTWASTASVNGGPEVTLSASGGQLTVPSFALLAGVNTVSFKNTWTGPSSTSLVPDPSAGGWQLNGSSALAGSELVLTPASAEQAGSAFWPQSLDPRNMTVEYDATIGGGSGADGLAFVIADPSKGATATSLGVHGGGLGFSGIPGFAVALDEFKNASNPSANFAGVSDGPIATATDQLHWLATANLTAALQGATHHVTITTANGALSVAVDGATVISPTAVALPASAFLGFSAGTGSMTNRHAIAHLVVTAGTAPAPATLAITNTIQAPTGSPQAAATASFTGTCPSSFTTAGLATGGSASPALTGAVVGSACAIREAVPAAAGGQWTVTASVNGGAAQTLAVSGATASLPSFTLNAGANTVAFTNTYQPATSLIPDPSAGGWKLNGSSTLAAGSLQLTAATEMAAGTAFWPTAVDPRALRIEFDATIGGGTGADGLALVFGDAAKGATASSLGYRGGGLGFAGIPGLAVALDEYKNAVNPSNNFVGVSDGPTTQGQDLLHWLSTATLASALQGATHRVTVTTSATTITVAVDGTQVLSQAAALPASAYIGFSGGTGGLTNRHAVAHLVVTGG